MLITNRETLRHIIENKLFDMHEIHISEMLELALRGIKCKPTENGEFEISGDIEMVEHVEMNQCISE